MIDAEVQKYVDDKFSQAQYNVAKIPYHVHNGTDSPLIQVTSNGSSGVSQILAGTNVSVSPAGGVGTVTVNATPVSTGVTQLLAGTAIGLSPSNGTGVVTITNTGVTSLVAGTNISLTGGTGVVTISGSGTIYTAGTGIAIAGTVINNVGVVSLVAGSNISLSPSTGTGVVTVTATTTGTQFASVSGTDSLTLTGATAPDTTTHTITHGLGKRPVIVSVTIPHFNAPTHAGEVNLVFSYQDGWLYLDTNGNPIGGMVISTNATGTPTAVVINVNNVTQSSTYSGGVTACQITINNFTNTTFDIVYASTSTTGTLTMVSSTIGWTAIG